MSKAEMMVRRASAFSLIFCATVLATDIEGVHPAALDQPRINVQVRRSAKEKPLMAQDGGGLAGLLGGKGKGEQGTFNIAAYLDTGASGIILGSETADALGIQRVMAGDDAVVFHDVGVGGADQFNVSEPVVILLAAYHPGTKTEDPDRDYHLLSVPLRPQIGPLAADAGLLGMLTGSMDVMGMPALMGKVVVMDPTPVNTFADTMRTYVYDPGTKFNEGQLKQDPGIPQTNRHVKLSYSSFARFTSVTPADAQRPAITFNPFIGPAPLRPTPTTNPSGKADLTPPITVKHNGKVSRGSWLLDTGAAASMISKKQAAQIGIAYVPGTEGTGEPVLSGVPKQKQFTLTVGGVGGSKKSAGFYMDELSIATNEGDTLVFKPAPVLVADIMVEDPKSHERYTLDGVFGMNFMVASAQLTEGILPDIGKMSQGAFRWIVFDQPNGVLGLHIPK